MPVTTSPLKRRREAARMTQRALAAASGVKQPMIAAYETGRRTPTRSVQEALQRALALRPALLVAAMRDEILQVLDRHGATNPRLFGSVARGDDTVESDVDLLLTLPQHADIADLLALEQELSDLLTARVDVISDVGSGAVLEQARSEAVAL